MKVVLAGFNVDTKTLKELSGDRKNNLLTPETISAAYARISRSPKSVTKLRDEARNEVAKARQSNRRIIFEMSHHSIAEHAVFNFDIIGISRLAVEEIEKHRLCSYTEKSQRYVTFKGDYLIPEEIEEPLLLSQYKNIIDLQNNYYKELFKKLKVLNEKKFPDLMKDSRGKRQIENRAKEDARYILSLATQTQLGATINARNLELILRRFASHRLKEVNNLGEELFRTVKKVAPSVILFYKANDFDQKTYPELKEHSKNLLKSNFKSKMGRLEDTELVDCTLNGDEKILSAILFKTTKSNFTHCLQTIKKMSGQEKLEIYKIACKYLELYDTVLREFELARLTYSLVVSAGCFAQLKRHRIATIITQDYDPDLGNTIPESIMDIGEEKKFFEIIEKTNRLYERIERRYPGIGAYILTNSHRRRVLISLNLRELYHISRLREDQTAQWDIQLQVKKMSELARRVLPITTALLCSKSDYPEFYYRLFNKYPKVTRVPSPG
uniref:FAD-dependent thymidylate synthase n=1 Tax=candidate division WOR-3 bacterium TaxID=2052148 RepID=A0A7C4XKP9_UNCW3